LIKYNELKEKSSEKFSEYQKITQNHLNITKEYLNYKCKESLEISSEKYGEAKAFTLQKNDELMKFCNEVYETLSEYLTTFFEKNRLRLMQFINEHNLKEKVLPIYDQAIKICDNGKKQVVQICGSTKQYGLKTFDNIIHNDYIEVVKGRLDCLMGSFYEYVALKANEYKNIDTLRDFIMYENSMIHLRAKCNESLQNEKFTPPKSDISETDYQIIQD